MFESIPLLRKMWQVDAVEKQEVLEPESTLTIVLTKLKAKTEYYIYYCGDQPVGKGITIYLSYSLLVTL